MRFYLVVLLTALLGALPASAQQTPRGFAACASHSIAATSPSSNTQLSKCGPSVILMNIGTQEAFYNVGQTAATVASAGTYSLPGGDFILLLKGPSLKGEGDIGPEAYACMSNGLKDLNAQLEVEREFMDRLKKLRPKSGG